MFSCLKYQHFLHFFAENMLGFPEHFDLAFYFFFGLLYLCESINSEIYARNKYCGFYKYRMLTYLKIVPEHHSLSGLNIIIIQWFFLIFEPAGQPMNFVYSFIFPQLFLARPPTLVNPSDRESLACNRTVRSVRYC